jgi:hypothetical protein
MATAQTPSKLLRGTPPHEEEGIYSDDGVDLTLIRWMLSLTPTQRLQMLQQTVESLARLCSEASQT